MTSILNTSVSLYAKPVKVLPSHQWQLISLPDEGASSDAMTLEAIFCDELDPATYFNPPSAVTAPTRQAYAFDETNGDYVALALSDSLTTGRRQCVCADRWRQCQRAATGE